jgi:hypothetical protein
MVESELAAAQQHPHKFPASRGALLIIAREKCEYPTQFVVSWLSREHCQECVPHRLIVVGVLRKPLDEIALEQLQLLLHKGFNSVYDVPS